MKKGKVLVGVILVSSMLLMTGCNSKPTAASLLKDTKTATEALKSTEANMQMTMTMSTQGISMDMTFDMDLQTTTDPVASYMNGKMQIMGQDVEMQTYTTIENDKVINYVYTMGTWIKQEIGVDMTKSEEVSKQIETMLEQSKNMTLADQTEKVDDKDVYVLTMSLEGEDILTMMSGATSLITSATGDTETADELEKIDYSGLTADMTYGIDKATKLPVYMNMTIDGMSSVYASIEGMENIEIAPIELKMNYTGYDTIDAITVPQEAIDTAIDMGELGQQLTESQSETESAE